MIKILHYPGCSQSNAALSFLQQQNVPHEVVLYMENRLTPAEISDLVQLLQIRPEDLVRKNEPLYREQYAGTARSDQDWIRILSEHPVLMQRPVLVSGDKAVIGRPLEAVEAFLKDR